MGIHQTANRNEEDLRKQKNQKLQQEHLKKDAENFELYQSEETEIRGIEAPKRPVKESAGSNHGTASNQT